MLKDILPILIYNFQSLDQHTTTPVAATENVAIGFVEDADIQHGKMEQVQTHHVFIVYYHEAVVAPLLDQRHFKYPANIQPENHSLSGSANILLNKSVILCYILEESSETRLGE